MHDYEKRVIEAFALGNQEFRDAAIEAHRRECRATNEARGTLHMDFMSEVDNPVPDLALRARYRSALLLTIANPVEVVRVAREWVNNRGD
jgi:hypothetical protein